MFTESTVLLIDKAIDLLGLDEDRSEDIAQILKYISVTIELSAVAKAGYDGIVKALDSPDLTAAERTDMLIETRRNIQRVAAL